MQLEIIANFKDTLHATLDGLSAKGELPAKLDCTAAAGHWPTELPMLMFGGPSGKGWRADLVLFDRGAAIARYAVEELPF